MKLSLRWHIYLTIFPLLLILIVLGVAGAVLLHRLGGSANLSIRENTDSIVYMDELQRALDRMDAAFQSALMSGPEQPSQERFTRSLARFKDNLAKEDNNITVEGEGELVVRLKKLAGDYEARAQQFWHRPTGSKDRLIDYGSRDKPASGDLCDLYRKIEEVSDAIRRLNREHMNTSGVQAAETANSSMAVFGVVLLFAMLAAGWLAGRTARTILRPIEAVIESARAIRAGNLDQVVPVSSEDELGQLAQAFNLMARHLRDYRQSQLAQLLRAQRTSQATIDSFPDPVLVIDSEGQVEMANPAARHLLGVAPKAQGQPVTGIWQPPEALRQPLTDALQGQRDYLPEGFDKVLILGATGRERAVLPHILTIRDPYGSTLGAAVLLQDVTRLRLLDQMKSNLVATASHELKTPLTSIRLAVHLLFEEAAGPLTPKQTELLQDARENCERLLAMVNNLLDLARLEQGSKQLDIRPEAPEELLRTAADAIRAPAEEKGVAIEVRVPPNLPHVAADASRIGTALRNLLDNAVMYTDSGGKITLSAQAGGDTVTLLVADTGCGISAEHLPHVFEKFFRVPGRSRGGGTGLGLAIVNEVVVAHGGTASCTSEIGHGTVFHLSLPVAHPEATLVPHGHKG
jgi:PAS domain S-box-containing protein